MGQHGRYGSFGAAAGAYGGPRRSSPPVGAADERAKRAQKAISSAALSATASALGVSLGTALGITGAAASATTAATATTGILAAAGVSVSVPVAGWIVAGVLVATATTITIIRAARKKGRLEMQRIAAEHGEQGKLFAKAYLKAADRSIEENTDALEKLTADMRRMSGKRGTKRNAKRVARIAEEMKGVSIVLATQIQPDEQDIDIVAGEPKTQPRQAQLRGAMFLQGKIGRPSPRGGTQASGDNTYLYLAGGLVGLAVLAAAMKRR